MKRYAVAVLELALEDARRRHATEVRFMSGMFPALVVDGHPRFLDGSDLKLETVRNIHHECLSMAGRPELVSRTRASYAFTSPKFGRYRCKYQFRGNIASLTVVPEADATEVIDAVRPVKRPSLRAEARPEESGPTDEGEKH